MPHERIAIVCCRRSTEADPRDLYPDADAGPLQAAFLALGVHATLVSWDDPGAPWETFSHILLSSTWDSVDRPAEYLAWARQVSGVSRLVNPIAFIEWNIDKVHQRQLEAAGVPVIPTTWVEPGAAWTPPGTEFVVKPSVSAGGRSTARYDGGDPAAIRHARSLQAAGQTVMVQPHLPAVDTEGETDIVFVAGALSHAVRKQPALKTGAGVVDRPWEQMAWSGLVAPSEGQLEVAARIMAFLDTRMGRPPTYARVDLITGPDGRPVVLEVELIDPYLSLDMEPAAASKLACAVLAV